MKESEEEEFPLLAALKREIILRPNFVKISIDNNYDKTSKQLLITILDYNPWNTIFQIIIKKGKMNFCNPDLEDIPLETLKPVRVAAAIAEYIDALAMARVKVVSSMMKSTHYAKDLKSIE